MVNFPSQIKNMDSLPESRYGLEQIMWTGKHINDQLPVVGGFNAFRKFARNFWGDFPQFLGVQSKKWFKRNQLSNPKMDLKRLEWLGRKGEELWIIAIWFSDTEINWGRGLRENLGQNMIFPSATSRFLKLGFVPTMPVHSASTNKRNWLGWFLTIHPKKFGKRLQLGVPAFASEANKTMICWRTFKFPCGDASYIPWQKLSTIGANVRKITEIIYSYLGSTSNPLIVTPGLFHVLVGESQSKPMCCRQHPGWGKATSARLFGMPQGILVEVWQCPFRIHNELRCMRETYQRQRILLRQPVQSVWD